MGSGHPYYPIDPWTLEGVLFNWYDFSLGVSSKRKNRDGRKNGRKSGRKTGRKTGQNRKNLLKNNSQASEKIKSHQEKDFLLQNYQSDL